ncbi:MAG: hypothetical protein ACR2NP_17155, partial [Pirellulaceae bacterium]
MIAAFQWLAVPAIAQQLPSTVEVIEDHIDAMGGEMLLRSMESFKLTGKYKGEFWVHYHEGTLHWHTRASRYWFDGDLFWQQQRDKYQLRTDISTGYP